MLPGIDVSVWDGHGFPYKTTNWSAYTWKFAFIKISEGTVLDPLFDRQWEAARGHTLRGAYHYFRPFVDPKQSALKTISYLNGDLGELPMALDIETTDGRSDTLDQAKTWLSWYEQETGVRPIIYTRYTFLLEDLHAERYPYLANYKAWIAAYPFDKMEPATARERVIADVLSGARAIKFPAVRFPIKRVSFYQWTALLKPEQVPGYYTGPRGKKEVDGIFYDGTEQELRDEFEIPGLPEPDPTEPPTEEPMPTLFGEVITDGLNIRTTPDTSHTAIGKLLKFDLVEASGKVNGWWKLISIKRGSQQIPLPGPACYSYEGASNGYIRDLSTPTPDPAPAFEQEITLTIRGVSQVYTKKP